MLSTITLSFPYFLIIIEYMRKYESVQFLRKIDDNIAIKRLLRFLVEFLMQSFIRSGILTRNMRSIREYGVAYSIKYASENIFWKKRLFSLRFTERFGV